MKTCLVSIEHGVLGGRDQGESDGLRVDVYNFDEKRPGCGGRLSADQKKDRQIRQGRARFVRIQKVRSTSGVGWSAPEVDQQFLGLEIEPEYFQIWNAPLERKLFVKISFQITVACPG